MDFDDCPPPLPPPVLEEETNEDAPEEPPMTTMDGSGGDAWIMRGLEVARSRATFEQQQSATHVAVEEGSATAASAAVADDDDALTPPPVDVSAEETAEEPVPITDTDATLDAHNGNQFESTNAHQAVFGDEQPAAEPIAVPCPDEEPSVVPANAVPPVLTAEEEERLKQEALIAEAEEEVVAAADRSGSVPTATAAVANNAIFDESDGVPVAPIVDAVVEAEEEQPQAQEEVVEEEDIDIDAAVAANDADDINLDDVEAEEETPAEAADETAAAAPLLPVAEEESACVPAEENVDALTTDNELEFSPQQTLHNEEVTSDSVQVGNPEAGEVVPETAEEEEDINIDDIHDDAAAVAQFGETSTNMDGFLAPNATMVVNDDESFPIAPSTTVVLSNDDDMFTNITEDATSNNNINYETSDYASQQFDGNDDEKSGNEQQQQYSSVAVEESDVEDDVKYDRLPRGDRVVRSSEFNAFATRAVELIQNLQDQKDAEVSTLNDDLKQLHEATVTNTAESIATAVESLETSLKTDYMNHIGALQQYLDAKVTEVMERGDAFVLENVAAMKDHVAFEIQAAENRIEVTMAEHRRRNKEKFAAVAEKVQYLEQSMDVMQQALQRAMDLEAFPEPRDIPEGKKIRLQVRLEVTKITPCPIILVPISEKANVADLKHEAIRRARRQNTISENVVFSKTAINFENLTLFDDDDFEDIGLDRGDLTVSLVFTGAEAAVQRHHDATAGVAAPTAAAAPAAAPPAANIFTSTGIMNMPPPPMPAAASPSPSSPNGGGGSNMPPPPPMPAVASFPTAPTRPNLNASKDIITGYFLREELAKDINDQELLERRLMGELERMERDPLKNQESLCRIRLAKDTINRIRSALVDKATYCYQEVQRAAARATLNNISAVMDNPTSSVDDYIRASNEAKRVVDGLSSNDGEQGRIDALEEAAARNQAKKERMKDDLEELGYELRNKLRVDYDLMPMAERLLDQIDRCSILAASMTLEELDEVHGRVVNFIQSVKAKQR